MLSDGIAKMESLVAFLKKLDEEQQGNRVSNSMLVRERVELGGINEQLDALQRKFSGQYRWLWNVPIFLVSPSIHETLKEVAV